MRLRNYSVPEFLQFETTYACNSHCFFCYNPARGKVIDPGITWEIIQRIGEAHLPLVQLTGGEVSILADLNRYIDYLSSFSKVSLVTNGILQREFSSALSKIFLSFHGDRATHEAITNNPGTYEKIVANIRRYVRQGFPVAADVILCSANYHVLYELIRSAAELGMREVFINRFQSGGIGVQASEWLMPPVDIFRHALDQILRARLDFHIPIIFGTSIPLCIDKRLLTEGLFANCNMGTRFATISPNGDLRLCNQALKSYGNILDTPLVQLWQDPCLDEYRNFDWVYGVCRDCPLLELCGTGCRVDNSMNVYYCPDAFIRTSEKRPEVVQELVEWIQGKPPADVEKYQEHLPVTAEPGLLFIDTHPEKYIVRSNYSCLVVEDLVYHLVRYVSEGESSATVLLALARQQLPGFRPEHFQVVMGYLLKQGVLRQAALEPLVLENI